MARIRTIKPEFFTSEDIVSLSPMARILYIALWCEADREGRLVWKPLTFKLRYLPADDCDIRALCDEIVERGLVRLYGEGYAVIPAFAAHQHINPRESASQLPDPCASVTRASRVGTRKPRASDAQGGREGKGKEGNEDSGEPRGDSPPVASIPLVDGTEAAFTQMQVDEWARAYPAVDVAQQLRQMRACAKQTPANAHLDEDEDEDEDERENAAAQPRAAQCPHAQLIDLFAKRLPMLPTPKPELWGGSRARDMRSRWRWVLTAKMRSGKPYAETAEQAIDFFDRFFGYVGESDFLTGRNGKWSGCTLAWLMQEVNFAKVIEGNFDNSEQAVAA